MLEQMSTSSSALQCGCNMWGYVVVEVGTVSLLREKRWESMLLIPLSVICIWISSIAYFFKILLSFAQVRSQTTFTHCILVYSGLNNKRHLPEYLFFFSFSLFLLKIDFFHTYYILIIVSSPSALPRSSLPSLVSGSIPFLSPENKQALKG